MILVLAQRKVTVSNHKDKRKSHKCQNHLLISELLLVAIANYQKLMNRSIQIIQHKLCPKVEICLK